VVRKTSGYGRFEGQNTFNALAEVYRFLPLFRIIGILPSASLLKKKSLQAGIKNL